MSEFPLSGGNEGYGACDDAVTFASFQPLSSLLMVNSFAARFPIYLP